MTALASEAMKYSIGWGMPSSVIKARDWDLRILGPVPLGPPDKGTLRRPDG